MAPLARGRARAPRAAVAAAVAALVPLLRPAAASEGGAGGGLRTLQKDLVELKDAAVRLRAEGGTDDELEQADADVEEVRRKVRKASSVTGAPDPSSTTEAPHRRRRHGSTTTGPDPVDQDDVVEGPGVMSAAVEDPVVEQPAAAQQHHKKQEHSVKGSHSPHGNESESVSVANTSRDTVHKRGSATTSKAHKNTTSTLTSTSTTKITKTTTSTTKTSTTKTSTTTITRTTTTRTSTSTTKTSTTRTTTSTTVTTTTTTTSTSTTSTTSTSTTTTRHHVWGGEGVSSAHDGWLARLRERYRFASPCGVTACPVPAIENARLPEALRGVRSKVTVTDVDTERGSQSAVESEGMGHALMVEGIEALRGNKTGLNNALGLARGWLSMAHGPKERPHPLGGGGDVTADPATKCSVSPYGVSAVQHGDLTSGLPTWRWPLNLCEGGCNGTDAAADQDAILGLIHLAAALEYPQDFVDVVVRAVIAFASADLGFPDLYRTLPDGTRVFVPKGGSSWGGLLPPSGSFGTMREPWCYSPGHFAPAHYRTFRDFVSAVWTSEFDKFLPARLDGTPTELGELVEAFDGAVLAGYNILYRSSCGSGATANWVGVEAACSSEDELGCAGVPWRHTPYVGEAQGTCSASASPWGSFGADASQGVWRVAMDYVLFREQSAKVRIYDREGAVDETAEFSAQLYLNRIAEQYVQHAACDGGSSGKCFDEPGDSPWKLAYAFEPRTQAPNVTCDNVPEKPSTWWAPFMAYPTFTAFTAPYPGIIPEASTAWMDTIANTCVFGDGDPRGSLCGSSLFDISQATISILVMGQRLQKLPVPPKPTPPPTPAVTTALLSTRNESPGDELVDTDGFFQNGVDKDSWRRRKAMDSASSRLYGLGAIDGGLRRLDPGGASKQALAALAAVVAVAAVGALASAARPRGARSRPREGADHFLSAFERWEGAESPTASYDIVPVVRPARGGPAPL